MTVISIKIIVMFNIKQEIHIRLLRVQLHQKDTSSKPAWSYARFVRQELFLLFISGRNQVEVFFLI